MSAAARTWTCIQHEHDEERLLSAISGCRCLVFALTSRAGTDPAWAGAEADWAGAEADWAGAEADWAGAEADWAGAEADWAGAEADWAGAEADWAGIIDEPNLCYCQALPAAIVTVLPACDGCPRNRRDGRLGVHGRHAGRAPRRTRVCAGILASSTNVLPRERLGNEAGVRANGLGNQTLHPGPVA